MVEKTQATTRSGDVPSDLILVTGGSRGIGRAISEIFAARGWRVVAAARSFRSSRARAPQPGEIAEAHLDVTREETVQQLFSWIDAECAPLGIMVNNAGVGRFAPFENLTQEDWRLCIDTNLTGAFLCAHAAYQRMQRQGRGRLIHIGSIADHLTPADNAAYAASKFGVRALALTLAEEGARHGVLSTLLSLGAVATDIWNDRTGYDTADMLRVEDVALKVFEIATTRAGVRVDEVRLLPPRGVL